MKSHFAAGFLYWFTSLLVHCTGPTHGVTFTIQICGIFFGYRLTLHVAMHYETLKVEAVLAINATMSTHKTLCTVNTCHNEDIYALSSNIHRIFHLTNLVTNTVSVTVLVLPSGYQ